MPTATVAYPLTIYYDGACPICATEMATLKRFDIADRLALHDCAPGGRDEGLDAFCRAAGVTAADLGTRIHARDAAGRWLIGIDVFVAAYDAAGFAVLARLFAHPLLRPLWERAYPWIARHRYALSRLGLRHALRLLPHRSSALAMRAAAAGGCEGGACGLQRSMAPSTDPIGRSIARAAGESSADPWRT